jgi:hypothetical protein
MYPSEHQQLLSALTRLCELGGIPPMDAKPWPVFVDSSGVAITPAGKVYLETYAPEVIRKHPEVPIRTVDGTWCKPPVMGPLSVASWNKIEPEVAAKPTPSGVNHEEYEPLLVKTPTANQIIELWEKNQIWQNAEVSAYLAEKSRIFRR